MPTYTLGVAPLQQRLVAPDPDLFLPPSGSAGYAPLPPQRPPDVQDLISQMSPTQRFFAALEAFGAGLAGQPSFSYTALERQAERGQRRYEFEKLRFQQQQQLDKQLMEAARLQREQLQAQAERDDRQIKAAMERLKLQLKAEDERSVLNRISELMASADPAVSKQAIELAARSEAFQRTFPGLDLEGLRLMKDKLIEHGETLRGLAERREKVQAAIEEAKAKIIREKPNSYEAQVLLGTRAPMTGWDLLKLSEWGKLAQDPKTRDFAMNLLQLGISGGNIQGWLLMKMVAEGTKPEEALKRLFKEEQAELRSLAAMMAANPLFAQKYPEVFEAVLGQVLQKLGVPFTPQSDKAKQILDRLKAVEKSVEDALLKPGVP